MKAAVPPGSRGRRRLLRSLGRCACSRAITRPASSISCNYEVAATQVLTWRMGPRGLCAPPDCPVPEGSAGSVLLRVHEPPVPRGPARTRILRIALPGSVIVVHLHIWDGPLTQQMVIGGAPFLDRCSQRKFSKTIKTSKLHLDSVYGTALDATEAIRSWACCSHAAHLPSPAPPPVLHPAAPSPAPSAAPHRHSAGGGRAVLPHGSRGLGSRRHVHGCGGQSRLTGAGSVLPPRSVGSPGADSRRQRRRKPLRQHDSSLSATVLRW